MENPLVIFWVLVLSAGLLALAGKRRGSVTLSVGAMTWLLICSATPVPQLLVNSLEKRYPSVSRVTDSSFILILGAGYTISPDLPATDQLSDDALARLVEGVRLAGLSPGCKLVFSGYSANGQASQAEVMGRASLDLGVSPADTVLLVRPSRTSEELEEFRARFGKRPVVVVSSAVHLPRVMAWCRHFDLPAQAAPAGHLIKTSPYRSAFDFVPSHQKILLMHRALHEYFGLLLVPNGHG